MNKSMKIILTVLLIIIGSLAITSGFLFAQNLSLKNKSTATDTDSKKIDESATKTTDTTTPTTTTTTTTTTAAAAASGDRPSSPADTYTVAKDDTLFSIGKQLNLSWTQITEANGIAEADANKIKVGQVLIIPKNNQVSYTVNLTKAQDLQKEVDAGQKAFRLSSLETAKSDSLPAYGLTTADTYKEQQVDQASGAATILATHETKNYEIKLSQPVTKGAKGIWAIDSIKLSK